MHYTGYTVMHYTGYTVMHYTGYTVMPGAYPRGGGISGTCPPLEPNAQRKKSTEIKRLEGADSAKISKIFKINFFFA